MTQPQKVTDPAKMVTDSAVLRELAKQGIDKDFVEFYQDYSPCFDPVTREYRKEHSPCAKFYRDLKSNKRFMVTSALPKITADGTKIEVGWFLSDGKYCSKPNNFLAVVDKKRITVTCLADQVSGTKKDDSATWQPQLFLDGEEQSCGTTTLLKDDPTPAEFTNNVLEWDYGICKRRIRIIEGRIRERWIFASNPNGEVRIKHNFSGNLPIQLGGYAINSDEELVPANLEYAKTSAI